MWFAADYTGPAAPEIMKAVVAANNGHAGTYGDDAGMERVAARVRDLFEAPQAAVFAVATGTAANALALATLCPPWATVFCHRSAHLETDECGAPEFFTGGAKLTLVDGPDGRISPEALQAAVARIGSVGVHGVQHGALALTNASEWGTVYDPAQIAELAANAHGKGMKVHLDGARFANALVHLGCSPAEASWKAGIDTMSLGGTKNGLLGGDLVILFDPEKAWEFQLRRKRGGHLLARQRHLAAQFERYFEGGLWMELASRANRAAKLLATKLAALPGASLELRPEANLVFARLPRRRHRMAMAAGAQYYLWPGDKGLDGPEEEALLARFACSWNTSDAEIAALVAACG